MIPATLGRRSIADTAGDAPNSADSGWPGQAAASVPGAAPNGDGGPPPASSASTAAHSAGGTMPSKRRKPSATNAAICLLSSKGRLVMASAPPAVDVDELLEHELVFEERGVVFGARRGGQQRGDLDHPPAVAHRGHD